MIIIMNMNFYVIVAIIIGATMGYMATSSEYCAKKDNHACCSKEGVFKKGYDSVE
jgi:hypothetical protein